MNYPQIAHDLLRTTDGLNNLEVDDLCLALGVDFEVIDNDGIARLDINEREYMILTVRFDRTDDGADALDVFYTVYELDENDCGRPVTDCAGTYVTGADSLATALSNVHHWVK
ncbi:hypothetical protein QP324_09050 [Corynebacterium sp. UMB0012]|uniref:hypothetical protein n=1 Tax=Corynebacterium sp. UMB0012 TaxID=3046344 RepID=UPI00254EC4D4|nr:hypothetical protein [Corynebacterium sp. UMB0012]MDK7048721.1 hypothetical protein [Corynebacterium sp. UMB0012]